MPRTIGELRSVLGPTPRLFIVDAEDNPQPTMRDCADGTTIVGRKQDAPPGAHQWWIGHSERGGDSYPGWMTFAQETDACFYAYCEVTGLRWSDDLLDRYERLPTPPPNPRFN